MSAASNSSGSATGYLYLFPTISFAEKGSLYQWNFAARVNTFTDSLLDFPRLQIWRNEEQGFRLVTSTNFVSEPTLQLGTLNVYTYSVNLTYEAGDFVALYQPPVENSKYLLAFVDSRNYAAPILAYEMEATIERHALTSINFTDPAVLNILFLEPLIDIHSTSTFNDSSTTGYGPFNSTDTPSLTTIPTTIPILKTVVVGKTTLPVVVSVVAGLLLLLVVSLVFALCLTTCYYMKKSFKNNSQLHGKQIGIQMTYISTLYAYCTPLYMYSPAQGMYIM